MTHRRTLIALPLLAVPLLAGCSSTKPAAPGGTTTPAAKAAAAAPAKTPGVGDSIALTDHDGAKITVTLVKVIDPATANYNPPEAGKHYVGVELKLLNTGSSPWSGNGAPLIGSHVLDGQGQSYGPILASTSIGTMFTSQVNIIAGGTALGAITFQVPNGVKAAALQIQLGMDAKFGQWAIG